MIIHKINKWKENLCTITGIDTPFFETPWQKIWNKCSKHRKKNENWIWKEYKTKSACFFTHTPHTSNTHKSHTSNTHTTHKQHTYHIKATHTSHTHTTNKQLIQVTHKQYAQATHAPYNCNSLSFNFASRTQKPISHSFQKKNNGNCLRFVRLALTKTENQCLS